MPRLNLPSRGYGVELETDRGTVPRLGVFESKRDGSINGLEFVSPILRGRAGLRTLRGFMQRGVDIRVDRSCGLHVHIGMERLHDHQLYSVFAAYVATQPQWHCLVNSRRHHNTYCGPYDGRTVLDIMTAYRRQETFRVYANMCDRYHWLNVAALNAPGTVENRLHQGTWNYAKVSTWIILNLCFVEEAKRMRIRRSDTPESITRKAAEIMVRAAERLVLTATPGRRLLTISENLLPASLTSPASVVQF